MYLIDRFSQLLRCEVVLDFINTWDMKYPLSLNFYVRTCVKFAFANRIKAMYGRLHVALNLTNGTLYLQHFMSIVNRNPISSFSGTGWSKNSMAWKRWLFWNNWSPQWSKEKKKNNLNEQNFKVYWKSGARIEDREIRDQGSVKKNLKIK